MYYQKVTGALHIFYYSLKLNELHDISNVKMYFISHHKVGNIQKFMYNRRGRYGNETLEILIIKWAQKHAIDIYQLRTAYNFQLRKNFFLVFCKKIVAKLITFYSYTNQNLFYSKTIEPYFTDWNHFDYQYLQGNSKYSCSYSIISSLCWRTFE